MTDHDTRPQGGRPPIGPPIKVRLPADLIARLDRAAAERGTTRSDLIRRGAELVLASDEANDG